MPYAIEFDLVLPKLNCDSPRQALYKIAQEIAASANCDSAALYEHMVTDERQASSACGNGVAIPHMKIKGLEKRFVTFAKLNKPLDFKAYDNQNVDLICVLLSPQKDGPIHLRSLSRITRMFKDEAFLDKIRTAEDKKMVSSLLNSPNGWLMAA